MKIFIISLLFITFSIAAHAGIGGAAAVMGGVVAAQNNNNNQSPTNQRVKEGERYIYLGVDVSYGKLYFYDKLNKQFFNIYMDAKRIVYRSKDRNNPTNDIINNMMMDVFIRDKNTND